MIALLLVMGLLLVPSSLYTAVAGPGVSGTVWFFPMYDNVALYPTTGTYTTLQLWVTPDAVMANETGIQQIDIWVPKDVDNLALYRVVNVEVALFKVTDVGVGSWVLAPPNWTVVLLDVDANNAPRHIQATANVADDALWYNRTFANGTEMFPYFRAAVFLMTVEWTRLSLTDGLASADWAVTLSGTDFTSQFHPTVTHYVDIEPPTYSLTSSTASLLAGPCLPSDNFNFTVIVSDNSGVSPINYTAYGSSFFLWDGFYGTPGNALGAPTGDVNVALGYTYWDIVWNPWHTPLVPAVPVYPNPLPNASTHPGFGYIWGELIVIANDTMGNYTQVYPLMSLMGTDTLMALNPWTGAWGVDLSPAGPWVGGSWPSLGEFTVKFYVVLFDGTIDYFGDLDSFYGPVNYGALVTNDEANVLVDLAGEIFLDTFPHPLQGATLTGLSTGTSVTVLGSIGVFGSWSEGSFMLNWSWHPFYGPDPTFEYFRVVIYHEDGNFLVFNDTTTGFSVTWDVWDSGIGTYNFTIFVADCGGEAAQFIGYFTVTEFVVVKLNGIVSKWYNYPAWLEVYQGEVVDVSIRTFGRAFNEPYQAVNVTVTAQNLSTYPPGLYNVITDAPASLVGGTATYGEWSFLIDVALDLGNRVGIYNVSVVWYNTSTSAVIASDSANTFLVKLVLLLDFWADDSVYTTGETVTFFAHVYDLEGNDIDSATVAVNVWDPTGYLIATTFGITLDGYVIPEYSGNIVFGVEIGDSWEPGDYLAEATTSVSVFVGNWWDGSTWQNLTATSTASADLTFSVSVLRLMDISNALSALASDVASISSVLSGLASDMSTVLSSLSSIESTLASLSSDVSSLVSDMSTVLSTLNSISNTLSTVASDVSGLVSTVDALASDVAGISDTLSGLASDISALSGQISDLSSELAAVRSALQNLATKGDVQNLASSLNQMSSDVTSTLGSISSLVMATAVLVIITLIVAAVTTFKVFRS